jgi:two-component system, OmpR family, sensor kinase
MTDRVERLRAAARRGGRLLNGWPPLLRLGRAERERTASPPTGEDGKAAATDDMALVEQMAEDRTRERSFAGYVAHELRTPISAMRARLEAAQVRSEPPGEELLRQLYREALALETLALNLLAVSRAEAGETRTKPMDLADAAGDAYDRFLPLALSEGHDLILDAGGAHVMADPVLIAQAVNNLVANAVHHTKHGPITIRSGTTDVWGFIEVVDTGHGMPNPIPRGIGLRVIEAVAQAHGGSLEITHDGSTHMRMLIVGAKPALAASVPDRT